MKHLAALHQLAAESKRILSKMNHLRDQYEQAQASVQHHDEGIPDEQLATESKRIVAKMNNLRDQYEQAQASGQHPDIGILDQMVATSRRFREVVEQMHASSEHKHPF